VNQKTILTFIFFLEAWIFLTIAKLLIVLFSFKRIAGLIGDVQIESAFESIESPVVNRIEISVIRAKKYLLFSSRCFDQALATVFMLKRRSIPSTIYFGLNKGNNQLSAHAWVRCGKRIVSGKMGYESFSPIAWFSY
jgi:hypothetical protein